MSSQEPVPAGSPRAVFGSMLRFYRLQAEMTQDQLGLRAHVSGKTIAAYENGWRVPRRDTTADIDAVPDLRTNGALSHLWKQFEEGMSYQVHPVWFQDWPDQEAVAKRLRVYQPNLVPGLLQTEEYARAVYRTRFGITPDAVEELELAWDTVRHEAESRAASLALLEEAAKSWTSAT